jgi:hypothetical protein
VRRSALPVADNGEYLQDQPAHDEQDLFPIDGNQQNPG